MIFILFITGCLGGLLLLAIAIGVGIVVIMQAGERDTVSTARQDWIQRRSDKDDQKW
jgi:hypothetical protein